LPPGRGILDKFPNMLDSAPALKSSPANVWKCSNAGRRSEF